MFNKKIYKYFNLYIKKGFSLLEIVFAISILLFFMSFFISKFTFTKKMHYENAEFLNKSFISNIAINIIRDRIYVNPNFLGKINNLVIEKNNYSEEYIFQDKNFDDKLASTEYKLYVKDIPVISKSKNGSSYYFGLIKLPQNFGAISSVDAKQGQGTSKKNTAGTFLNVESLANFTFDIAIENDDTIKPSGMLKNFLITIKPLKTNTSEIKTFSTATKLLCPQDSLPTESYLKIQQNITADSQNIDVLNTLQNIITDNDVNSAIAGLTSLDLSKLDQEKLKKYTRTVLLMYYASDAYYFINEKLNNKIENLGKSSSKESLMKSAELYFKKAQSAYEYMSILKYFCDDPKNSSDTASESNESLANESFEVNILKVLKSEPDYTPALLNILNFKYELNEYKFDNTGALENSQNTDNQAAKNTGAKNQKNIITIYSETITILNKDFEKSISGALDATKKILDNAQKDQNYLTPREELKIIKDFVAYKFINSIYKEAAQKQTVLGTVLNYLDMLLKKARAYVNDLANKFKKNDFFSAEEYLSDELKKIDNISFSYDGRYKIIFKKYCEIFETENRIKNISNYVSKEAEKFDSGGTQPK